MNKRWLLLGLVAVGLSGLVTVGVRAEDKKDEKDKDEVKVTIDQVPAPVKETLLKEVKDGKITDVDRETKDGKTVYEADATVGGADREIKVAEDGTLISNKQDEDKKEGKDGDKDKDKDEKKL